MEMGYLSYYTIFFKRKIIMEHSLSVHAYVHCKVVHGKFHTQTSPAFYLLAQQILISSIWYVCTLYMPNRALFLWLLIIALTYSPHYSKKKMLISINRCDEATIPHSSQNSQNQSIQIWNLANALKHDVIRNWYPAEIQENVLSGIIQITWCF